MRDAQVARSLLPLVPQAIPASLRRLMLNFVPSRSVAKIKEIVDAMERTSRQVIGAKKGALEKGDEAANAQVGNGNDIMSILCTFLVLLIAPCGSRSDLYD